MKKSEPTKKTFSTAASNLKGKKAENTSAPPKKNDAKKPEPASLPPPPPPPPEEEKPQEAPLTKKSLSRPPSSKPTAGDELTQRPIELSLNEIMTKYFGENRSNKTLTKWSSIIDNESGSALAFLKEKEVNVINSSEEEAMKAEALRAALLSSLKNGKELVIDFSDSSNTLFDTFKATCQEIHEDLYEDLFSKRILEEERYKYLIKPTDNEEEYKLAENVLETFLVLFVVKNEESLHLDLIKSTILFKVAATEEN